MKVIFVIGCFGSGTTAVTGAIIKLGAIGIGPYNKTNDPRTSTSFEQLEFKSLLHDIISERDLLIRPDKRELVVPLLREFRNKIEIYRLDKDLGVEIPFVFKQPMVALIIPEILKVFDAHFVYVLRPMQEIEASRRRRNWSEMMGVKGACLIYSAMFNSMVALEIDPTIIHYNKLLSAPEETISMLAIKLGLSQDQKNMTESSKFILEHKSKYA